MEIKIVPIVGGNKTSVSRSKYMQFFSELFTEENLERLKQSLEQIRGNPSLGIMIDITDVKNISVRKNKISERGVLPSHGEPKAHGTIANALLKFFAIHNITDIQFTIKERDDGKVYLIIRSIDHTKSTKNTKGVTDTKDVSTTAMSPIPVSQEHEHEHKYEHGHSQHHH